ncbi:phage tail protein E' [Escherichia coli]|nr:phage tail protein E' [Escherichia coli]
MSSRDFIQLCAVAVNFMSEPDSGGEERAGDGSVITLVCFEHIEDLVADIAAIFNWSPAEIFMMTPGEVVSWRERAALRSGNADNEDS